MQEYLTAVLCLILDKVQAQGGQTIEIADFFLIKVVLCDRNVADMDLVNPMLGADALARIIINSAAL